MKAVSRLARLVPERGVPWAANVLLDTVRQEPAGSAAVLQGVFAGRTAPHRAERRTFKAPALVIGHHRDPVHPFSDAGLLAEELPNAQLLEASSILELRIAPDRLTDAIAAFIHECWRPRSAQRARRHSARA
jgi:pimeloyl-ACP methyl ester carboxylesterase